jgi:hypothetical protein
MGPNGVITLQVTAANGGEKWMVGTTKNVTWTQTGLVGTANVDLYKAGVFVKTLGTADVTTGTYSWAISAGEPAGTDYRVRVSQGGAMDESDANFSVVHPAIKTDLNGDGQTDILWRYSAAGGNNMVWFLGNVGLPAQPLAAQSLLATSSKVSPQRMNTIKNKMAALVRTARSVRPRGKAEVANMLAEMDRLRTSQARSAGLKDPRQTGKPMALREAKSYANPKLAGGDVKTLAGGTVNIAALGLLGSAPIDSVPDLLWEIRGTGDFNNDGSVDLLWRHNGSGANCVWTMTGTVPTGILGVDSVADVNWQIVGTGDFNNDGSVDILWHYNGTGGPNCVWYMTGAASIGVAGVDSVADLNWQIVGAGDLNNDGFVDILWRYNGTGGYDILWTMTGVVSTGILELPPNPDLNWKIVNR